MPPTRLKFGPAHHGRPVTADELDDADYVGGYRYEVIAVFVTVQPELTIPEPDIPVYRENLDEIADGGRNRADFHPLVVVEVLVESDPVKHLVRNVELDLQVPSIAECWNLDGRQSTSEPLFIARRRWGARWLMSEVPYGETDTTRTLPGFELLTNPRR